MDLTIDQLEDAADKLPIPLRERLIERLLKGLRGEHESAEVEISKAWLDEAERRLDELRTGRIQALPGDQLFENVRRRVG